MYKKVHKLSPAYKCSQSEGKHATGTQVKKKDATGPLPPQHLPHAPSQSFPYKGSCYPDLTAIGSFCFFEPPVNGVAGCVIWYLASLA